MSHKLYSPLSLGLGRKAVVAGNYAGVAIDLVHTTFAQLKTKEFQAKNPNQKFPILELPNGKHLYESNAILRYVARLDKTKGLYGEDLLEESQIDQWLDWSNEELTMTFYKAISGHIGHPFPKDEIKSAEGKLKKLLMIMEQVLKINTYLVGNKVTIADIAVASLLHTGFRFTFDEKFRKIISNVTRWYENLMSQEPFVKEFGRVILCQKALEVADLPMSAHHGHKEEKKKEEAPKKAATPAAKKEEPKKDDEKKENPLDLLPPSPFNFFDFKTLFVNAQDKNEACDFFFKNFDANGFSVWKIDYIKAEGEGKVLFLTSNLMNGFLQRLEHFRKYGFGVHGVYGDEPTLEIRGVWAWRGTEIPEEVRDVPSYEYHKFSQLDVTKDADKDLIRQYWTGLTEDESNVDGLTARTVKYFK
jgi:elongation factor 1-gamma